ncbi:MAG TPA: bifunctional 4-hydroxy-2-oxoglutarate aldolase/2-dehydro-3-deoxy-phosphogluconate aldolase [Capillimicrobium sp.]|nr:bifunctional 4-hydroxy-2-oxoglutarate aldolase/2-dehydro-3-deoxy-phosphogluconate aldolase [Capillimicrobium sp.]
MTQEEIVTELGRRGVVAVVRGSSPQGAVAAGRALAEGGVTAIEVTFTVPRAAEAIRELAADERLLVGAGTVLTRRQAHEAVAAGARYLLAPNLAADVTEAARELDTVLLPGVMTPTEVAAAMREHRVVKLFPADLGGPGYLKALRGPFPDLRAIPTGGVTADNIAAWLGAGALAVGAGGDLCPPASVDALDAADLRRRAERYAEALRAARAA